MSISEILLIITISLPFAGVIIRAMFGLESKSSHGPKHWGRLISAATFVSGCTLAIDTQFLASDASIGSPVSDWINKSFQLAPLSLFWILLLSGQLTCWMFARHPGDSQDAPADSLLLVLGVTQLAILLDSSFLQLALIGVTSWIFARDIAFSQKRSSAKRWRTILIVLSIADVLWLLGLQSVTSILGSQKISSLVVIAGSAEMGEAELAMLSLASLLLVSSLVIRLGFFPFQFWLSGQWSSRHLSLVQMLFPLFTAAFLVFRWEPLLGLAAAPRTLLISMASFSSLMLASTSLVAQGSSRVSRITMSQLGILAVGALVMDNAEQLSLLAGLTLCLPVWMTLAGNVTFHRSLLVIWLILLSGVLGQQMIFEAVWKLAMDFSSDISPVIFLLLIMAHGISSWSAFEMLMTESPNSEKELPLSLFFAAAMAVIPLAIFFRYEEFFAATAFIPFWSGTIVILAWFGVRWKSQRETTPKEVSQSSMQQLLREDFHTERFFQTLFVIPTEILAMLFAEANQLLFRRGPAWLFAVIQNETRSIEEIDAQQNSLGQVVVILLTLAVLIGCLVASSS